jgi:hypothetical protein
VDWAAGGRWPFDVMTDAQAQGTVARYTPVLLDTGAQPVTEDLRELTRQVDVLLLSCPSATHFRVVLRTDAKLAALKNLRVLLTQGPPAPSRAEATPANCCGMCAPASPA